MCNSSYWPNETTFADRRWRAHSVTAGPVTFLNAKRLARAPVGEDVAVKIRTLVAPSTPVTIAIGRAARATAGFVPTLNGASFAAARPAMHLAGCDGVPPGEQVERGVADVGYPMSVVAQRAGCVPIDVTPDGGRSRRVVIALGVRSCARG